MIIWGSRAITSTVDKGEFYCPHCAARKSYRRRRVRRFFTLYFIPLIPMQTVGKYIECEACTNSYEDAVLNYDPEAKRQAAEAQYRSVLQQVIVGIATRGPAPLPQRMELARAIYTRVTSTDFAEQPQPGQPLDGLISQQLPQLAGALSDHGKETLVKAAVWAATVDGAMDEEAKTLVAGVARGLGVTDAHLRGLLAEALGSS